MAQRDTKHVGSDNKGKPGSGMQDKAETKTVRNKEDLEREEELREKYTDEENNPDPEAVPVSNPNRNKNKVDIDKGSYNGRSS
ncbi:MAG: hypothetical protein ACLFUB_19985 [Cyclobacteriaceae bacterium]